MNVTKNQTQIHKEKEIKSKELNLNNSNFKCNKK